MSGETFQKLGSGVELGGYFGGGSIYSSHLLPIADGVAMLVTMEDGNSDQSVAKCRLIGVSAVGEITVGAATVIPTQWYDSNGGQTFAQWIMQPIHLGNNKVILPMEVNVIDGQPNGYMVEANPGALTVSYIGTLGAAVSVSANPRIVLTDYSGYGLMLDPDNNTLWWFDPDGTQHGMFSGNALTQQLGVEAMNGTYTHCGVTGKVAIIPDRGSIPAYNEMTVWDIDFVGRTVNSKTSVTIPGMDNRDTSNIAPGRTAGTVTLAAQTGIVTFSSRVRKDEFETVSITGSPTPSSDFSSAVEASSSPDNYFSFDAIAAADDGYVRIFNLYNSGNEAVVLAYHRPSSGFRKTITVETSGSRKYTDIVPVGNGLFLYQYEDDNYNVLHLGVCGVDISETSSWITGPLGPTTATPTYPGYEWPYEWGGVDAPVWLGATWKYCGITNPGGGTLNLKASDDTYTAPTYTPGSFDWGTPSAGAVDGPVTPVFDRWGDAAFNTIISPNAVSWGVGTTSTATHSVNISPGPSGFTDNNWADLPLGSDDWLVLGLLWRTTDYDRSGTIQVGNPTFDPATDGPAGWTYVGATPTADTTGWATPMPSLDGTRGAVWVVKYSDIAGTTDVNVTVNAYSTVFIKRIKVKSGWADPVVLLDVSLSGERTNASSTQIIPSDWAEGKNFGTRIAVVEIGYAGPYPSSGNDDNVGISTPYAGSSRSTSAWAWLAVEFATPVGSSPGLTLTEGALPDYTLNMDLVGQTGGVTSSTGTLDDWILYDPGPDYYVTMPDGSTVSLSPWGLERAPDGASGVGVFVCAASADTSAELTLELAAPGLSSSVTIPMSEFGTPPANPVLDPFLIPVETFYLPDAPAGWIDAYEAGTLSLTVTASGGPIYVWQVGMVSTYPTGSAFISDPIESEWDQAGTSGRTGWITDSLSVEMPAPPDLNHESIPNIFDESATPVRTSGVGFSTPNPTLARLNAAMGSPLGTYFETQKWSSVTITFGMEPKNLSIANEPQYRDGYPGYDLGAIGWYEEATEAARRHDINGWLSPAWYRWHQYYTSLAEHPEYEVSSTVTIRVPWTAHSDAPGGSNDYQWQIRFAPDAVVGDPQDPADKFDWDTYIPGGHDPSGQSIIGTAPVLLPEDTQSGVEVVNLLPGQFSMAGKDYTWVVQASQENVSRPYLDGPVSLFTSDEASTSLDYQHPTPGYSPGAWLDFKPGPYRVIFPSSWEGGDHSTDPYPGGGSGTDGGSSPGGISPGRWHTADNYEPPPPGKPAGDGGVEDGWVHVSWMRRKDLGPGSGRTGRLKLRVKGESWGLSGGGGIDLPTGPIEPYVFPSDEANLRVDLDYVPTYLHTVAVSPTTMLVYWLNNTTGDSRRSNIYGMAVRYVDGALTHTAPELILDQDSTYWIEPFSGTQVAENVAGFSIDEAVGSTTPKVMFVHIDPSTLALTPFPLTYEQPNNSGILLSDGSGNGMWHRQSSTTYLQEAVWFSVDGGGKSAAITGVTNIPIGDFLTALFDADNDRQHRYLPDGQTALQTGGDIYLYDIDYAGRTFALDDTISTFPVASANAQLVLPGSPGQLYVATTSTSPTASQVYSVDLGTKVATLEQSWAISLGYKPADIRNTYGHLVPGSPWLLITSNSDEWNLRTPDGTLTRIDQGVQHSDSTYGGSGMEAIGAGVVFVYSTTEPSIIVKATRTLP